STATTLTPRSPGSTSLPRLRAADEARPLMRMSAHETQTREKAQRRSSRRVVLVAACSQRKRAAAPPELTLASIDGAADERIREWRRRLARVPAPRLAVSQTYAGDHWHAVLEAYRLACVY